jgi:hypothetical protein
MAGDVLLMADGDTEKIYVEIREANYHKLIIHLERMNAQRRPDDQLNLDDAIGNLLWPVNI